MFYVFILFISVYLVPGRYTLGVKYGGDSVPQSPFRVNANPTGDASKCKVSGPGVKNPLVGKPAPFEVDAKKAGKGKHLSQNS